MNFGAPFTYVQENAPKKLSEDGQSPARNVPAGHFPPETGTFRATPSERASKCQVCKQTPAMPTELHHAAPQWGPLSTVRSPRRGPEVEEATRLAVQQFGCTPTLFWRVRMRVLFHYFIVLIFFTMDSAMLWDFGCQHIMHPFIRSQNVNVTGVYNMYDADSDLLLISI
jgi:hypothetical protein